MIWRWLAALLAAIVTAQAQTIEFAAPASGQTATLADGGLAVQWSGDFEPLAEYKLQLMVGGDSESQSAPIATVNGSQSQEKGETAISIPVSLSSGPSAVNAYFLRMSVARQEGGEAVFYSNRFSIAGMTGEFPESTTGQPSEAVRSAYQQVKNDITAVPGRQGMVIQGRQIAADGSALPYSMQTAGVIKYAPMQQKPPRSITAVNTQPMYPTSGFDVARAALPTPSWISTQTLPVTYTTSSAVNHATAAAPPQDDMAKYLARWKD